MMKKIKSIIVLIFISVLSNSQNNITATFSSLADQQIKLVGFNGFDTYVIDSTLANKKGKFSLNFNKTENGVGYLISEDKNSFLIILADNEDLQLKGDNFSSPEIIVINKGKQNKLFEQYAIDHTRREQCLGAWDYLTKIYAKDSLFAIHSTPVKAIEQEKQRIKSEDKQFLDNLPKGSYVKYYLPLRKLVSSVSSIAKFRTEEIPATINDFRKLDYTDDRLYKSGMLKETLEAHFWLIENSGRSLDSVYMEMNKSIDVLIENLLIDENKLNEVTQYLFELLEKRSLFTSSQYLALKLLNEQSCTINNDFAEQLESYKTMKIGNTAADIEFINDIFAPQYQGNTIPKKLSNLKSRYTVVVFGASWCPHCPQELSKISRLYNKWKKQEVEVVFVSLDETKSIFKNFASVFPFISICDYKKWESPIVKDYHVFATPTLYLLNNKREILLRPSSVDQMDAWIDWYLIQGKK
jgi:thiol-disulfide isomerase/thioredoxin